MVPCLTGHLTQIERMMGDLSWVDSTSISTKEGNIRHLGACGSLPILALGPELHVVQNILSCLLTYSVSNFQCNKDMHHSTCSSVFIGIKGLLNN